MKLTSKRFSAEDFQGEPSEWIPGLLSSLNTALQELQAINTNGINIVDNLNQEIIEIKFLNDSVAFPIKVRTKFNQLPKGVQVLFCRDTLGGTPSNCPWIDWSFANQNMTISAVSSLTTSNTYTIRFLVIYS